MSTKTTADLREGDRVQLFGTVVLITGAPYQPEDYPLREGYARLPMVWDGLRCAPPMSVRQEVELAETDAG
jgi:hypothetical protein